MEIGYMYVSKIDIQLVCS